MSVIFFASVVKETGRNAPNSTELSNYKRLLDKVSHKIEKWHRDQNQRNKVLFTKDDEYVEDE